MCTLLKECRTKLRIVLITHNARYCLATCMPILSIDIVRPSDDDAAELLPPAVHVCCMQPIGTADEIQELEDFGELDAVLFPQELRDVDTATDQSTAGSYPASSKAAKQGLSREASMGRGSGASPSGGSKRPAILRCFCF
jgi:hypothetical protein